MSIDILHRGLSNACLLFSLVVSGYGFALYFRRQGVSSGYWGVLAIAEALFVAQAVVGIALASQGLVPARSWVHYLYGVVGVISLPGLYAFLRGRDGRRDALLYALLGLFLAGISLRAAMTAVAGLP